MACVVQEKLVTHLLDISNSNTHNIPLVNASSAPITGSQVSAGNRYIAYFNKCDNVIQLMSYTPAAPTPAA